MRLLLDTQAFVLAVLPEYHSQIPAKARRALSDPGNSRLLSVLSVSEIALKTSKRKLAFTEAQVEQGLQDLAVELLPVRTQHVFRTFQMPLHHSDPLDRMIIAAALEEDLPLVGGDIQFSKYKGLTVIWR